jgi:hypothetical protein
MSHCSNSETLLVLKGPSASSLLVVDSFFGDVVLERVGVEDEWFGDSRRI